MNLQQGLLKLKWALGLGVGGEVFPDVGSPNTMYAMPDPECHLLKISDPCSQNL